MDNVQYAIEIVDKWGQPMKRFKSELASVDRMRIKDPFRNMPRSVDQLKNNINRYKRAADNTFRTDHLRKYNMLIGQTEKKIRMLEGASQSASVKTNMLGGAMKMLPAIGVAGGIMLASRSVSGFGKDSIMAAAAFEKYGVTLRTMLGSQGAARERMTEYADIAKKTPFELQQVVESGNQLQAIGRYSRGNVTMLGDLAAASGKPIEQVMNAYAKLSTGQKGESVNMFRDLLISSEDWAKATGKGIKKNGELAATTEEMITALPKILKKKGFFGMMDQQAKTTEGKISNLSDSFYMLKESAGEKMKPAFDEFLSGTANIVESMNKWVAVPVPEKIAREKAELNALVGVITDANTGEQVRSDLINNLQQQYPEFLKGIDLETIKNEDLRKKLAEVNKEYENKLRLASMKGLYSQVEQDYEEAKTKLGDAQLALYAKNEFTKTKSDIISLMNDKGFADTQSGVVSSVLADNVSKAIKSYYSGQTLNYSEADIQKLIEWSSNYATYEKFDSMWSSPENAVKKYGAELNILQQHKDAKGRMLSTEEHKALLDRAKRIDTKDKSTYDKLFGKQDLASEFDGIRQKGLKGIDAVNMDEWQRLASFLSGDLKYKEGSGTDGGNGLDLGKASATIDGGGKNVKQVNVHIDSLLGNVTNQFRDTDTVQDADNFLEKLSTALQLVVNDVNYSAK
ncbi:MAG: hypothetical protein JEY96_16995 [Bacteroidales bacterium]|nr:hypothetical protein [Bacteroidales bacterium]